MLFRSHILLSSLPSRVIVLNKICQWLLLASCAPLYSVSIWRRLKRGEWSMRLHLTENEGQFHLLQPIVCICLCTDAFCSTPLVLSAYLYADSGTCFCLLFFFKLEKSCFTVNGVKSLFPLARGRTMQSVSSEITEKQDKS